MDDSSIQTTETKPKDNRSILVGYFAANKLDELDKHIRQGVDDRTLNRRDLIDLAIVDKQASALVKKWIDLYSLDENELADLIAKEILADIEAYVDDHLKKYHKYTLNAPQMTTNAGNSTTKFFNLINLLRDVSVLGRRLLELSPRFESLRSPQIVQQTSSIPPDRRSFLSQKSKSAKSGLSDEDATSDDLLAALIESSSSDDFLVLSSSLESISIRDMIIAAQVLIKSHECFTLSHDIQGVVMVLRRTKFMIMNILAPKNQMELVTKLLTSIGRYNEMNYVFDLFRDRNQFEILLSKGVEKTSDLRIALFNYVKKNPEFYTLVTLNFSMFREIAESLEASALKRLDRVIQCNRKKTAIQKSKVNSSGGGRPDASGGFGGGGGSSSNANALTPAAATTTTFAPSRRLSTATTTITPTQAATTTAAITSAAATTTTTTTTTTATTTTITPNTTATALTPAASSPNLSKSSSTSGFNVVRLAESGGSSGNLAKPLYSREILNLCLVELVDASDCFAKAGCYNRSNNCERKAKLIALQLALLPSETNVLDLQQNELNDLIVNRFESFTEAYVLAEAYDYHLAWRQAIFNNVLLNDNEQLSRLYLEEFCKVCDLSRALVMELVFLYKQFITNNPTINQEDEGERLANSLKMILARLVDVELRCKIYTQLNFNDSKEELLANPCTQAHLRDLRLA